jgi:hypothetical protein
MKFKCGDKVKLKSWITRSDLKALDIFSSSKYLLNHTLVINEILYNDSIYSNLDCSVLSVSGAWHIPQDWLEPIVTGHPYTDIFKA